VHPRPGKLRFPQRKREAGVFLTFPQLWRKLVAMNMITILLGATGLLLVVAVVLSFGVLDSGAEGEEADKLKSEIAALRATDLLASQEGLFDPAPATPYPAALLPSPRINPIGSSYDGAASLPPPSSDSNLDVADLIAAEEAVDLEAEMIAIEEENLELAAEKNRLEKENQILKNEVGVAWQPMIIADAKNMARAETIKSAMLLARVTEWDDENGFAVIDILNPDLVQTGSVLAIRRQTGIYGQITVDQMYPGGQAVANPVINTFMGEEGVDVQPGDELILPPL
jgi:hypothetical protein